MKPDKFKYKDFLELGGFYKIPLRTTLKRGNSKSLLSTYKDDDSGDNLVKREGFMRVNKKANKKANKTYFKHRSFKKYLHRNSGREWNDVFSHLSKMIPSGIKLPECLRYQVDLNSYYNESGEIETISPKWWETPPEYYVSPNGVLSHTPKKVYKKAHKPITISLIDDKVIFRRCGLYYMGDTSKTTIIPEESISYNFTPYYYNSQLTYERSPLPKGYRYGTKVIRYIKLIDSNHIKQMSKYEIKSYKKYLTTVDIRTL